MDQLAYHREELIMAKKPRAFLLLVGTHKGAFMIKGDSARRNQCVHHMESHPDKPDVLYQQNHCGVYRSKNRGGTWKKLHKGLPTKNAYFNVNRQAMTVDSADACGIYVGTSTGQIFYSKTEGETWKLLMDHLPHIYSLECARL